MERDSTEQETVRSESGERALERLASGWIPQDSAVADSGDAAVRADLEALALLAYELEPEAPAEGAKERLMAGIRAASDRVAPDRVAPDRVASDRVASDRSPVDMTLHHMASSADGASADGASADGGGADGPVGFDIGNGSGDYADKTLAMSVPAEVASARYRGSSGSLSTWALAAALALCLVGLGYFYGQVNTKNATIAMQQDRLESARAAELELDRALGELQHLQDSLAMVTSVAQIAYPLKPSPAVADAEAGRAPSGKVFVCGQHQRWYLSLSHLEEPPEGQEYHLWFLTRQGAVDAGKFEPQSGAARMEDLSMPDGTQGFQVTLEPVGSGDEPSGRTIMIGDRPIKL